MKNKHLGVVALLLVIGVLTSGVAHAQVDARMFRQPAVSKDQIAFVYAGDIWVVPKKGGTAVRLSSPAGEESFPRFSPDGSKIAYSAAYDGNLDVYVVSAAGGEPTRLTYHPMQDRVIDWHPDGKRVLFASGRESGRQRFNQFYLVGLEGGLPEKLPVPYGEFAAFSPDGSQVVYMPMSQDFRTWKRYRGGWSPDLWTFDLKSYAAKNITNNPANDAQPMWHAGTIYFLSDRGASQRNNLWALRIGHGTRASGHQRRRLRHHVPVDRSRLDRVSGRRAFVPVRPGEREDDRGSGPCGHRRDDAAAANGQSGGADRRRDGVADGEARRVRDARRRGDAAGRERRGHQRDPLVWRGRALPALVARWKDDGLLERSQRRVRVDGAPRRRVGCREEGHEPWSRIPVRAVLVSRQQAGGLRRSGDESQNR